MKNRDFLCENRPDRSKSQQVNTFFGHSHRAGGVNRVRNRDFSLRRPLLRVLRGAPSAQGTTRLEAICNALSGTFCEIRPHYRTLWCHSPRAGQNFKIMLIIMIIRTSRSWERSAKTLAARLSRSALRPRSDLERYDTPRTL